MSWVAVGLTVATTAYGAYSANKQSKEAKAAAEQQNKAAQAPQNQLPEFRPPPVPGYVPFDFTGTQAGAIAQDRGFYRRSDRDFKRRHKPIVEAEKIFEASVLQDQKGDRELMPQVQAELMRAGVGNALGAFGDTGANLTPGGAGEASVARNLGLGILGFQDRNRANRERSLSLAEDIFPRRTFGMSGQDFALTALSDTANRNAFNSANYAAEAGTYQKNYEIDAENKNARIQSNNELAAATAAADAARRKATTEAVTSIAGTLAQGYGSYTAKPGTTTANAPRPAYAKYPGTSAWVPVGKYAGAS